MSSSRDNCNHKFIISVLVIAGVTILASLIIGGYLLKDVGDHKNMKDFGEYTCTLHDVTVVKMNKCACSGSVMGTVCTDGYAAMWNVTLDSGITDKGFSAITSPSDYKLSKDKATELLKLYSMGSAVPCMCNFHTLAVYPVITRQFHCDIWSACVFDIEVIKKYQAKTDEEYIAGNVLLGYGVTALCLFAIVGVVVGIMSCCDGCCHCNRSGYSSLN